MDKKIKAFQDKILSFYQEKGRTLPWRETTDPYKIWISEIMLQQTQVDRVKDYWKRWLDKWPTVQDLASADRRDVLAMWSGLGYNNRAVNLHKAAQKIVDGYHGNVVAAVKNYKNIPGIGPYTSAAVQIFSRNSDVATVDTNIRRILLHEFSLPETTSDKELWGLARECLPLGQSRDWHNGLMDYGSSQLTARKSGIRPKTRQSKFEGSDRQIRGKVLKHFLQVEDGLTFDEILGVVGEKEKDRLLRILEKQCKDGVLREDEGKYYLVS